MSEPSGRLVNGPLEIDFAWHGDRYAHVIGIRMAGSALAPLLTSIEGDSETDWPPSPALQQLSIERGVDGIERAMLVGMAGKSHFSLVVEPTEHGFHFDVACRAKAPPDWLGSQYLRPEPGAAAGLELPELVIAGVLADRNQVDDDPANQRRIIAAACSSVLKWPSTIRWQYICRSPS